MYNVYSYKKKRPTGLIITIIICTCLIATTGYFIYKNLATPLPFKEKEELISNNEEIVINNTKKDEIKYDKNAELIITNNYLCGHNITTNEKIPESFIGKTISEIKNENNNLEIISYNDYSISCIKVIDTQCDNHYIIKLKNNKLISYNKNTPDIIVKEIVINLREYLKEDILILQNGIEVGSKEELLEFYEDFL